MQTPEDYSTFPCSGYATRGGMAGDILCELIPSMRYALRNFKPMNAGMQASEEYSCMRGRCRSMARFNLLSGEDAHGTI